MKIEEIQASFVSSGHFWTPPGFFRVKGPRGIYAFILTIILKNCKLQEHKNKNTH